MTANDIQTIEDSDIVSATETALVIADTQIEFTPAQVAALKQLGVDDAPRGDLDVFFHTAKRTGLDPFARQIYLIGRKTKVGGYRGEPERWETKYTIQTGIEGYRVVGHRIARREGVGRPFARRQVCGRDGVWREVLIEDGPPVAAKAEIICDGQVVGEGIVKFVEYAQTRSNGELTGQWRDKPTVMIGKCAEAAAWRAAFPHDFSGVYEPAEFDRHEVIDGEVISQPVRVRADRADKGLKGLRAAVIDAQPEAERSEPELVVTEPDPGAVEPTSETPEVVMITSEQSLQLHALLSENDLAEPAAGLAWISSALGRPVTSTKDLTEAEAATLIDNLDGPAQ